MSTVTPREERARVGRVLRAVRALGPVDIAFAASVDRATGTFVLDRFDGARTDLLRDLVIPMGEGVGGRCIALERPVFVRDYVAAKGITHRFDGAVAGEGLSAMFAVPVKTDGVVRDVVYGAARTSVEFGEGLIDQAVDLVNRPPVPEPPSPPPRSAGDIAAELAEIAAAVPDPAVRHRLTELSASLSSLTGKPAEDDLPIRLSPRELDVLTAVAMGHSNVDVARRLGLTVQTVKSYLKSAMAKLDSHTRGEAVYRARRAGLLP
ncbi:MULTISPECIES: LuxR C-terminal-related transcriptional regulator [unclassified Amycolatopsis]|uniref:LuxR C-terminal-related transcriptional regulator n=1 Tax=unclassified Amycolatopsis TaxID=2618356 RepID=UPI001C6A791F|nr:LuxR C-terminal-related transcriptional regulator [Amycolatopsis sp. DSM 110486]QYN17796.1 LuxR C-terminal-related transcriptional regulator [Amycolatopsis sp. DSM 110486]